MPANRDGWHTALEAAAGRRRPCETTPGATGVDDIDALRADLRAKRRAYYAALDAYQAALKDSSSARTVEDRLRVRVAMLEAHVAYTSAQTNLEDALRSQLNR